MVLPYSWADPILPIQSSQKQVDGRQTEKNTLFQQKNIKNCLLLEPLSVVPRRYCKNYLGNRAVDVCSPYIPVMVQANQIKIEDPTQLSRQRTQLTAKEKSVILLFSSVTFKTPTKKFIWLLLFQGRYIYIIFLLDDIRIRSRIRSRIRIRISDNGSRSGSKRLQNIRILQIRIQHRKNYGCFDAYYSRKR